MSKAIEIEVRVIVDLSEKTRGFISSLIGARGRAGEQAGAPLRNETAPRAGEQGDNSDNSDNSDSDNSGKQPEPPRPITPEDIRFACNAVYKSLLGDGWETHPQKKTMTRVFKDMAAHFGSMTRKPSDVPADRRGEYLNELSKIMINQSTGEPEWIPFDTVNENEQAF